jgi:hypothetical protein
MKVLDLIFRKKKEASPPSEYERLQAQNKILLDALLKDDYQTINELIQKSYK